MCSSPAKLQSLEVTPMAPWRTFPTQATSPTTQRQGHAAALLHIATVAVVELPSAEPTRQYLVRVSSKKHLAVARRSRAASGHSSAHCVTKQLVDFETLRSSLHGATRDAHRSSYCAFCRTVQTVYPASKSTGESFGRFDQPELVRRSLEQFVSDLVAMHHASVDQAQHECHGKRQAWELLSTFLFPSNMAAV